MGIELELAVLLALTTLGPTLFAKFEIETPRWRRLLKWTLIHVTTLGLYLWIGHYSLIVPLVMATLGCVVHWTWCRRHGIDPWHATPRARYYELRGWAAWE